MKLLKVVRDKFFSLLLCVVHHIKAQFFVCVRASVLTSTHIFSQTISDHNHVPLLQNMYKFCVAESKKSL